jgi:hypothetical protein
MVDSRSKDGKGETIKKPEIIPDYNKHMFGVELIRGCSTIH